MSTDGTKALPLNGRANVSNGPDVELEDLADLEDPGEGSASSTRHPLFRLHPVTRRVALYVAPLFMAEVDAHTPEQSADLVSELLQPAVCRAYAHRYRAGDLVLWDNRCMLHSASPLDLREWGGELPGVRLRIANCKLHQ
eukprot:gene18316-9695_t